MLQTDRLKLRQWQTSDRAEFARMNADAEVMRYYPSTMTTEQSEAMADNISSLINERGWGFWAVEHKHRQQFLGFVGLHEANQQLPFAPCIEIGWRLGKEHWGQGYATEAAIAALEFAFTRLELDEVFSFTATINKPSQAVMKRIGMVDTAQNFAHPAVERTSPLSEHVLYRITRQQWQDQK